MKMQEINAKAKGLGINPFGKTKASLIREIQRKEGNFDCFGTANGYCDQPLCCFRSLCIPENRPQRNGRTKASAGQ
jgi:hypothetical protein